MSVSCGICGNGCTLAEEHACSVCSIKYLCASCRDMHDRIVKRHAVLCHIAIDNTIGDSFAGVLCRVCGKEAKCDHL